MREGFDSALTTMYFTEKSTTYSAGPNYLIILPALYSERHNYFDHLFVSFAILKTL